MRNLRAFLIASAFTGLLGSAGAQPLPPPPPGLPAPPLPPLPGDLHVRIVGERPPAPRHEVVVVRPSRHHVWIRGYWHHAPRGWVWVNGRWTEPPRRHAYWVSAHYRRVHGGWRYIPGHWSYERVIS